MYYFPGGIIKKATTPLYPAGPSSVASITTQTPRLGTLTCLRLPASHSGQNRKTTWPPPEQGPEITPQGLHVLVAQKMGPRWPSGLGGCACKGHWHHNLPDWSPHRRFSPAGSAKLVLDRLQCKAPLIFPAAVASPFLFAPHLPEPCHVTVSRAFNNRQNGAQIVKMSGVRAQVASQNGIVP